MDTVIYYFSGTGNSLSVARAIHDQLGESELLPMIGCLKQKSITITAQRVGFVFPMHFMTIPCLVKEFLEAAQFKNTQYLFVVITGANPKLGNALSEFKKCLKPSEIELNAAYFIPMVAAHFPYIKLLKAKKPALLYQEAHNKAVMISESISQLKNGFDKEFTVLADLKQKVSKDTKGKEKHFTVGDRCIRCGYCMQVCPFQNIRLHAKQVQWLDNCHSCFACLHFCSQSVIEYKKLSIGKPRHHHPSVELNDIALQRRR